MRKKRHVQGVLALMCAVSLCGCNVPVATHQELLDVVAQYQVNTITAIVYYTGSDQDYDYFYIDIPFEKDRVCKVKRTETDMQSRRPISKDRQRWTVYNPPISRIPPSGVWITAGSNTVIYMTNTNIGASPRARRGRLEAQGQR